jgi:hypothetical protein
MLKEKIKTSIEQRITRSMAKHNAEQKAAQAIAVINNLIIPDSEKYKLKVIAKKIYQSTKLTNEEASFWNSFPNSEKYNRRKFLEALSFHERNSLLTGDPFLEFDPCTYVLMYLYPNQVQDYPAIQQAFPHIVQQPQSPGASSTTSSNFEFSTPSSFSQKSSPFSTPSSKTITLSDSSPSPSPTPSTSKSSKFFSVPNAVLRSRTVQTTDQPKPTARIRRNLLKQKSPSGSKAPQ